MDFFQAQDSARKRSTRLVIYYLAAVAAIILSIYAVIILLLGYVDESGSGAYSGASRYWDSDLFLGTAVAVIVVVGLGSLFKMLALRSGGGAVARSLGGELVRSDTSDPQRRRLLNVVEEMAIASGIRVPEVYVLPESGINAFAAGYSPDDAAVAVTQGALDALNRDELQGVVAHEFSHILNGDMRLNIRLIGLLFGILLIAIIGRIVIRSGLSGRSSSRDNKGGGAAIALLGVALIVIGYIGVLFGRLIQAAVSRQREFLADASAVQFTRNPDGIAGALKKIGRAANGGHINNAHASETSHLFFASALGGGLSGMFATHPPLKDRIKAIDPSFNGNFNAPSLNRSGGAPVQAANLSRISSEPPPIPKAAFISAIAVASVPNASIDLVASIPETLYVAAHDTERVRALVLALLHDPLQASDAGQKQQQIVDALLASTEQNFYREALSQIHSMPTQLCLPLLDIALPTLKTLPAEQLKPFLRAIDDFVQADGTLSLREFSYRHIIERGLNPPNRSQHRISSPEKLLSEISLLLSTLAKAGSEESNQPAAAFKEGANTFGDLGRKLYLLPVSGKDTKALGKTIERLDQASIEIKKTLLEALANTVASDGKIEPLELELLRATSAALGCPAPVISAPA